MEVKRPHHTLAEINGMGLLVFARVMASIYANASWIPVMAFPHRPYSSIDHLHGCLMNVVKSSDEESKTRLVEAQPDLINPPENSDAPGDLLLFKCDLSFSETLEAAEKSAFQKVQTAYLEKFFFPLVFAPFGLNKNTLLIMLEARLLNSHEQEMETALTEIGKLARLRLVEMVKV